MNCLFRSNNALLRIEFSDRVTNTVLPLHLVIEHKKHEKAALKSIKALVSAAVFKRYDSCVDADALLLLTTGGSLDTLKETILATVANVPRGKYSFVFAHRTLWLRVDIAASLPVYTARICSFIPVDPEDASVSAVTQVAVDQLEKEEVETVAGALIDASVAVVIETQAGSGGEPAAAVATAVQEIVTVPLKERTKTFIKSIRVPTVSITVGTVRLGELKWSRRSTTAEEASAEAVAEPVEEASAEAVAEPVAEPVAEAVAEAVAVATTESAAADAPTVAEPEKVEEAAKAVTVVEAVKLAPVPSVRIKPAAVVKTIAAPVVVKPVIITPPVIAAAAPCSCSK